MAFEASDEVTVTAFLWATWLEEDDDRVNLLVLTPKRQFREKRMHESLNDVAPCRIDADGTLYHTAGRLREAWERVLGEQLGDAAVDDMMEQMEVTKLKLIPALRDVIQGGKHLGRCAFRTPRRDGFVAWDFFCGLVNLAGQPLTMGVPTAEDDEGKRVHTFETFETHPAVE